MDRDEKLYFDELSKKSLSEIKEIFQNLKHIGMSDEDIEHYMDDASKRLDKFSINLSKLSIQYGIGIKGKLIYDPVDKIESIYYEYDIDDDEIIGKDELKSFFP